MKIAITGTHSTGKTTLAHKCSQILGLPYVRGDTIKNTVDLLYPGKKLDELSLIEAWNVESKGLENRIAAEKKEDSFVSDGCTLNSIAYLTMECGDKIKSHEGFDNFSELAHSNARDYNHIIYLPPETPLEDDGFRPLSDSFRNGIDEKIRALLEGYAFHTIMGSIDRRSEQVKQIMGLQESSIWDNYIAFEGLPRAGKTTQIKLLEDYAKMKGHNIFVVKRLKNKLAEDIKKLRNSNPYENAREIAEMFCELQRNAFEKNNVEERLFDGQIVISDRQKYSTLAMCNSLGVPMADLYRLSYHLPSPGKVIYVRLPPVDAVNRAELTNKEYALTKDVEYISDVSNNFDWLNKAHRFVTIDGSAPIISIHDKIIKSVFGDDN